VLSPRYAPNLSYRPIPATKLKMGIETSENILQQ
jgi:hypothetical protein